MDATLSVGAHRSSFLTAVAEAANGTSGTFSVARDALFFAQLEHFTMGREPPRARDIPLDNQDDSCSSYRRPV